MPSGIGQGSHLKLRGWQKKLIRDTFDPVDENGKRKVRQALWSMARKNGKGLALDTPIPTPTGWTTMGEIEPGDLLLDDEGRECFVTFVSPIRHLDCYEVEFSNGETIVCDGDHLWRTKARIVRPGGGRNNTPIPAEDVRDTRELYRTQKVGRRGDVNHSVRLTEPVEGRPALLPIDPYLLGAWLGDGTAASAQITAALADTPALIERVEERGYECASRMDKNGVITLTVRAKRGEETVSKNDPDNLQKKLRALGVLGNKHIPATYLRASLEQRLALLQGLMDTDGTISKNGRILEYTTTLPALAAGMGELLSSLGVKWTLRECPMRCNRRDVPGVNHRIQFCVFRDELPVFSFARKLERMRNRADCQIEPRSKTLQIVAVRKIESVPTKCIQVDSPNRMFLCGKTFIPTHNTALAAGLVLCFLVGPEAKLNGEVLSAASDREQAGIIYKMAKQMVELDEELSQMIKPMDSIKRLVCYHLGSFYQSLAADARRQHGGNPLFCIYDELAQAKDRELWDVLSTAFGAQEEGLLLAISTQSSDPESIMSELADDALKQMEGQLVDPHFFGHVFFTPEERRDPKTGKMVKVDFYDEREWYHSNPALGDFRSLTDFRARAEKAKRSPAAEAAFRNLFLNQRVDGVASFVTSVDWRACEQNVSEEELLEAEAFGGLDLSERHDLTAFVLVFVLKSGKFAVKSWFWTPDDNLLERAKKDGAPYQVWAEAGHLALCPGRTVSYSMALQDIWAAMNRYNVVAIAYDRWKIEYFKKEIEREGLDIEKFNLVPHGQGFKDMAPAITSLEEKIIEHALAHNGNPVLTYCLSNVKLTRDNAGNRKFDKKRKSRRIDGAVALAMAVAATATAELPEKVGPSVYEERGVISF